MECLPWPIRGEVLLRRFPCIKEGESLRGAVSTCVRARHEIRHSSQSPHRLIPPACTSLYHCSQSASVQQPRLSRQFRQIYRGLEDDMRKLLSIIFLIFNGAAFAETQHFYESRSQMSITKEISDQMGSQCVCLGKCKSHRQASGRNIILHQCTKLPSDRAHV